MQSKASRKAKDAEQIISGLYEGVLDEDSWRRATAALANVVRGDGPVLMSISPATGRLHRTELPARLRDYESEFSNHWARKDIRFQAGLSVPLLEPHTEEMILPRGAWERSEIFNEFLAPADAAWFVAAWLHKSPTKVTAMSIHAPRDRGRFSTRDAAELRRFMPHLRRALDLKERLDMEQVRRAALQDRLGDASFGYAILDDDGSVREMSANARSSLQSAGAIDRLASGRIELVGQISRQLATMLSPERVAGPFDGFVQLRRRSRLPIGVAITRVPGSFRAWLGSSPASLLFVFDPELRVTASIDVLMQDLGVTRREAELAALLAEGQDLRGIARRLGIGEETARKHLKSIFAKTDLHSQAALVHRVVTGPAWVRCR